MKNIVFAFILFFLEACSSDKPKNLISKDKMAYIILDIALYQNDDVITVTKNMDPEGTSNFILQKNKISKSQYIESYNYYLKQKKIEDINKVAIKKLLKIDPQLDAYIKNKEKEQEKKNTNNADHK